MADGFGGYSPYTGAGNLASAMGANPSFGGYTGGYQAYGSAPTARLPMTPGYAPSTPASPAFTPPTFTNSMSNWIGGPGSDGYTAAQIRAGYGGGGGGENISAMTPSSSGNFQVPGGGGGSVDASSFDPYSMMGGSGGGYGGYSAAQIRAGYGGGSPMGTALANAASYPNPGVNLYSSDPSLNRANILSGLFGNEYAPGAESNPYQMTGGAMQSVGMGNQPASNAAQSEQGAGALVDLYSNRYHTAGQVATAYNQGPGNVNPNYNPNVAGSTPYLSNRTVGTNVTPQQYLYGNPSSGYQGFYQNQNNAAVTQQFGQAAGAGQGRY